MIFSPSFALIYLGFWISEETYLKIFRKKTLGVFYEYSEVCYSYGEIEVKNSSSTNYPNILGILMSKLMTPVEDTLMEIDIKSFNEGYNKVAPVLKEFCKDYLIRTENEDPEFFIFYS